MRLFFSELIIVSTALLSTAALAKSETTLVYGQLILQESNQQLSGKIKLNGRSTVPLKLPKFTPSTLSVLKDLNGTEIEATTDGEFTEILATVQFGNGFGNTLSFYEDGAYVSGNISNESGSYSVLIPTNNGSRRLNLTGPILESNRMSEFDQKSPVALEGILRDDGTALQVTRIRARKANTGEHEVLLSGILYEDSTKGKGFFIDGPKGRRWWLSKKSNEKLQNMLGESVLVGGEDFLGRINIKSIELKESQGNNSCITSLLEDFMQKRME